MHGLDTTLPSNLCTTAVATPSLQSSVQSNSARPDVWGDVRDSDMGLLEVPPKISLQGLRHTTSLDAQRFDPLLSQSTTSAERVCFLSPRGVNASSEKVLADDLDDVARTSRATSPFDAQRFDPMRSHQISPAVTRPSTPPPSTDPQDVFVEPLSLRSQSSHDSLDTFVDLEGFPLSFNDCSMDSTWSSDADFNTTEDWDPQPRTIYETFHFPGAQFDNVRAVERPNPRFRGPLASMLPSRTASPARSRSRSRLHPNTSCLSTVPSPRDESPSGSATLYPSGDASSPTSDSSAHHSGASIPYRPSLASLPNSFSITEAVRALTGLASRCAFEEEVEYRAHEYLLEQAGCGRVEIWVTEETEVFCEERGDRTVAGRRRWGGPPRVFFPPSAAVRT
ncbi:hypothetical protein AcV5_002228 [Taiwanofungus camphoratus]|nr:hypothetical protein AcV5_002228 [Antrodia cinnamomea]KAI0944099.1 hypothetical protein AcV7_002016 [Antrodia cinnamomea]